MSLSATCPECGEVFELRRTLSQQKYCTSKCKNNASARAWRERNRAERRPACAECGGPIEHLPKGRPRRFCSEKCKAKASNTRNRRALPPLRVQSPAERTCPYCEKPFVPMRRDRIYCYGSWCVQYAYQLRVANGEPKRVVAHAVICDGCGSEFIGRHPTARWCSKRCANRHWGNVRARQRQRPTGTPYTDLEIFERDGWRCHICKKKVRRDVPRLHPLGATIDHLVPISEGGLDEPSNVATAHWKCNRDKRARAMNEQLAIL